MKKMLCIFLSLFLAAVFLAGCSESGRQSSLPVSSDVSSPVSSPVSSDVSSPVSSPVTSDISSPVSSDISSPVSSYVSSQAEASGTEISIDIPNKPNGIYLDFGEGYMITAHDNENNYLLTIEPGETDGTGSLVLRDGKLKNRSVLLSVSCTDAYLCAGLSQTAALICLDGGTTKYYFIDFRKGICRAVDYCFDTDGEHFEPIYVYPTGSDSAFLITEKDDVTSAWNMFGGKHYLLDTNLSDYTASNDFHYFTADGNYHAYGLKYAFADSKTSTDVFTGAGGIAFPEHELICCCSNTDNIFYTNGGKLYAYNYKDYSQVFGIDFDAGNSHDLQYIGSVDIARHIFRLYPSDKLLLVDVTDGSVKTLAESCYEARVAGYSLYLLTSSGFSVTDLSADYAPKLDGISETDALRLADIARSYYILDVPTKDEFNTVPAEELADFYLAFGGRYTESADGKKTYALRSDMEALFVKFLTGDPDMSLFDKYLGSDNETVDITAHSSGQRITSGCALLLLEAKNAGDGYYDFNFCKQSYQPQQIRGIYTVRIQVVSFGGHEATRFVETVQK